MKKCKTTYDAAHTLHCLQSASDSELIGTLQPTHDAFLVMNLAIAPTLLCVMILDRVWSPSRVKIINKR